MMRGMNSSGRYERTLVGILFFTWGTVFLDRMSPLYLAPYFAPEFHWQCANRCAGVGSGHYLGGLHVLFRSAL